MPCFAQLGFSEQFLLTRMKLTPARGLAVTEATMRQFIERHGGAVELVEAHGERTADEHVRSLRYFARARLARTRPRCRPRL